MEIFGRDVGPGRALVGMGVRPHRDPRLVDTFEPVALDLDATQAHDYAVIWRPDGITWTVDGRVVRETGQSPGYPMQLMLGLYAFEPVGADEPALGFVVESVSGDPLDGPAVRDA
jgi:hypothetical protein